MDSIEGDRQGLIALFNQCNGRNWTRKYMWLTGRPIGEWDGVKTNGAGRLIEVLLDQNNLTGSLPKEIGNWGEVLSVNLQRNNLTGSLPREIGNWTQIQSVSFSCNNLTGNLPREIKNWTKAFHVFFAYNIFTGRYPFSVTSTGYKTFYTCYIRRWVLRERRRFLLCLV